MRYPAHVVEETLRVVAIEHAETGAFRRFLGRDGGDGLLRMEEDRGPLARHWGARSNGELVAVVSVTREATPFGPAAPADRFYALVVRADWQRRGVGRLLIESVLRRARSGGARLVWAKARDQTLGFYRRLGFAVAGDGFIHPSTGLPSHVVVYDVESSPPRFP